jgi:uncharacterized protein YebE (UPF0316 family)
MDCFQERVTVPNPVLWLIDHPTILPFIIFGLRICDVSLDTLRMICTVRGLRLLAAMFGFFAVLIWVVAISSVMKKLDNPFNLVAYAAGYATGNWVGIWLESRLALGQQLVRIISYDLNGSLAEDLRKQGFVVTELEGQGRDAPVKVCFIAARRREVPALIRYAQQLDPNMFVTVEDVRTANRPLRRFVPGRLGSPPVIPPT